MYAKDSHYVSIQALTLSCLGLVYTRFKLRMYTHGLHEDQGMNKDNTRSSVLSKCVVEKMHGTEKENGIRPRKDVHGHTNKI